MIPKWLGWLGRRAPTADAEEETPAPAAQPRVRRRPGLYHGLYTYLENRHADTVVLTLAQIEDLVGFPLPAPARADQGWWTDTGANPAEGGFSDAWTLAHRTARPNLQALTVTFERVA